MTVVDSVAAISTLSDAGDSFALAAADGRIKTFDTGKRIDLQLLALRASSLNAFDYFLFCGARWCIMDAIRNLNQENSGSHINFAWQPLEG